MRNQDRSAVIHEQTLPREAGADLRYTVALPGGYTGERVLPLVLALHYGWPGGGRPAPFYGKGVLLGLARPALAPLGAIIVAPDCPGHDWANEGSEAALLDLLAHLEQSYPLDLDRLLLLGYSLGGIGTWYLAARHPARFSAAIPISASPPQEAVDRLEGIPLYVIHGRQDELMPIERVEAAVGRLEARGLAVEFVVVEGVTHFETYRFVEPLRAAVPWIRAIWGRR